MKFKIRFPKFRNPFANGIDLKKIQRRLFNGKKRSFKLNWRKVGKYALWTIGTLVLVIVIMFAWFAKDLPTPGKIRALTATGSTRLFARNGEQLYTISGDKKRILIDGKDIPDNIKEATIAIEDKNFYHHHGIDTRGVLRALIFGGSHGGGSTITQQYVKNALLDSKHSVVRKIKEAILAMELEAFYSKEDILKMYLNEIPYGGRNYGIQAAAKSYFNKPAKELTLSQAATLAALPQQPTTLSPYGANVDKLLARRDLVLNAMKDQGYITQDEAEAAKAEKIAFAPRHDAITAPHFVLYVKDWLVKYFTDKLGDSQLAEQKVEEGGLDVTTTLDLDKQQIAEDIVAKAADTSLKKAGASNAGLVTIDPKRGEIIAMVGSVNYFQPQFGAFNVAEAKRQPGSSFKPIVYSAAFKEKYNPATVLFDLKTDFGKYIPENFDGAFRGPISIRQAIGNSLNIPAVKTLGLIGLDKALQNARDMGITTLTDKDRYGLSLVLGSGEVKLTEMTAAYGIFANNGVLMPTTPILKITESGGKMIYDHTNPEGGQQVLDPQIAYEISSILSDTEAKKPVFSRVLNVLTLKNRPVAVKTGTTDKYLDAWTIGYTPQYVTGVWAGNNDNSPMDHAGGSVAAAPIWDAFMVALHQSLPILQFDRPAGIKDVTVDRLSNKLPVDGSEPVTDIFASWQVPTEKDNVHVKVRVCKENGLLAGSDIPDSLAELRTYTNVHSEKPDNPNWEGPVLAWAAANGLNNRPPTEKCQAGSNQPTIQITAPTTNQTVSGSMSIAASASAPSGVKQVEFFIDNASIGTDTNDPYATSYNTDFLADGSHELTAIVTSSSGSTATDKINFTVSKDASPPHEVTSFTGVAGTGQVSLNWVNPSDSDFTATRIYYRRQVSVGGYTMVSVGGSPSSPGVTTISGLTSHAAYEFVAKTVDDSGNESSGVTIFLTPL